jgi:hypothetical protein
LRKLTAVVAVLAAALMFGAVRASADNVVFGVNDDAGKYENGAGPFFSTLKGVGMTNNTMTLLWDEAAPATIPDSGFLAASLKTAAANGVDVTFDVYPLHSLALGRDPNAASQFAAWVASVAQAFPQVKKFVVMNECNQPRFINPQFDASQKNASAAVCGNALALAYDALKAVDPSIFVWGLGLSPRGNDDATAASNVSTSPIKFLGYLGQWYRGSGRTKPLMDGLDLHPYPIPQSLPFESGYAGSPNNYSVSNLTRVYQAFYDAFKGTGQPTIGPGGMKVSLNEVGIQTDSSGRAGYTGSENADGVSGATGSESFQADWYTKLVDYAVCDPNVAAVNLFHLVDESALEGWQSGLYYAGYTAKASAAAVQSELAKTAGRCPGKYLNWKPGSVGGATIGTSTKPVAKPKAKPAAKPKAKPTAKPKGKPATKPKKKK